MISRAKFKDFIIFQTTLSLFLFFIVFSENIIARAPAVDSQMDISSEQFRHVSVNDARGVKFIVDLPVSYTLAATTKSTSELKTTSSHYESAITFFSILFFLIPVGIWLVIQLRSEYGTQLYMQKSPLPEPQERLRRRMKQSKNTPPQNPDHHGGGHDQFNKAS